MGTNYFVKKKKPRIVKVYDEEHIGKSSAGNKFTIQTQTELYKNFEEFKNFLLSNKEYDIINEYDEKEDPKELLNYIEKVGYEFEDREFS